MFVGQDWLLDIDQLVPHRLVVDKQLYTHERMNDEKEKQFEVSSI